MRLSGPVRIGVLQLIDSLALGGAERMAVNLANDLPRDRYVALLCATRSSGPMAEEVRADVELLFLNKRSRADMIAVRRLAAFVRKRRIGIVHAHSTSVFTACLLKLLLPGLGIVWHQHLGRPFPAGRPPLPHWLALSLVDAVVAVSRPQAEQAVSVLKIRPDRVFLIHNYAGVVPQGASHGALPGNPGARIVCLAQLRPEKDHGTLLRAFRRVVDRDRLAHLLVVGGTRDTGYAKTLVAETSNLNLENHVTFLGERQDIGAILGGCDIGVLSSTWEGLPLTLLEYGQCGLPVVATNVGECGEVLDRGRCGLLVEPSRAEELSQALLHLLASPELRSTLGSALRERVHSTFSREAAIQKLCAVYASL